METLHIEATKLTPGIVFDPQTRVFLLEGMSMPGNAEQFYKPVIDWVQNFFSEQIQQKDKKQFPVSVEVKLSYYNSSSARFLVELFKQIKKGLKEGFNIEINWFADSEDKQLQEAGAEMEQITEMKFNFLDLD